MMKYYVNPTVELYRTAAEDIMNASANAQLTVENGGIGGSFDFESDMGLFD